ncbi:14763_t:CDS:1, partial [Racocetra fulgida]
IDAIQLPTDIILQSQTLPDLLRVVYPDLSPNLNLNYFVKQAILAPKNEYVNTINSLIMNQFPGDTFEYFSADTIEEQAEAAYLYP